MPVAQRYREVQLPPKLLLLPGEAAHALSATKRKVYELVASGELEASRLGPRGLRIVAASLERLIARNKTAS